MLNIFFLFFFSVTYLYFIINKKKTEWICLTERKKKKVVSIS